MMREGKSQQDATKLNRSLVHPRNITRIENWNIRTLYRSGSIAQVAREMTSRNIDVMGISETHWTEQGKMQLTEGLKPSFTPEEMTAIIEKE